MILAEQLRELLAFRCPEPSVLSVQLAIGASDHRRALGGALQALRPVDTAARLEDLKRVEQFVEHDYQPGSERGLVLFSAKRRGLWRVCPLPEPVKTRIQIGQRPSLAALVNQSDQYHRYGVAVLGGSRARFLEIFMGRHREYEERRPQNGRAGSFVGDTASAIERLTRSQGFDRIVLCAPSELESAMVDRLRPVVQNNLILDQTLTTSMPAEQIARRVQTAEAEARRVRESVLAHRLVDEAGAGPRAVLGLARTLWSFENAPIRSLFVRDGFAKMGRCCAGCGRLSLLDGKCVSCGRPTVAVFNVVEELAQRALDRNAELVRLLHPSPLDNHGHIGALLAEGEASDPRAAELKSSEPNRSSIPVPVEA